MHILLSLYWVVLVYCQLNESLGQRRLRRISKQFDATVLARNVRTSMTTIRENVLRVGRPPRPRPQAPRKEICYDTVGCFDLPRKHSPLKKVPENPTVLNTKFYLFRRDIEFSTPAVLEYGANLSSLLSSNFNPEHVTKVLIHGYMSSWRDEGELAGAAAFLKIDDVNVVLVDWENGAKGPQYSTAAANTEIVGRQVGLLLLNMVHMGADPKHIHLIGFSLGAHIAGCASELLKQRGLKLGRITGLDPASPLFKHHLLREKSKKLDVSDAIFVDVIHTDGSPVFTDGFGLLEPIGHVDFFPNGGREQPGCTDGRGSVVVSHFEGALNRQIACSHIRAWEYYLESLAIKASADPHSCKFMAYPCQKGLVAFTLGRCFPAANVAPNDSPYKLHEKYGSVGVGYFGEDAHGSGPMYLVTRDTSPYCGTQLQASVLVSQNTPPTRGILQLQLQHSGHTTNFHINCELLDIVPAGHTMYGLAAAAFNTVHSNVTTPMVARLSYQSLSFQSPENVTIDDTLRLDQIRVRDMYGHSWQYCGIGTEVVGKRGELFETLTVPLTTDECRSLL